MVRPTSLEPAFQLDGPGEYEIRHVLINGVRTFRDDQKGAVDGPNVAFVYELDGLHAVHIGDIGHPLTEAMIGEIGTVDVVCIPIGGRLTAVRASELVAQLDANLVVPLAVAEDEAEGQQQVARFLHEMGVGAGACHPGAPRGDRLVRAPGADADHAGAARPRLIRERRGAPARGSRHGVPSATTFAPAHRTKLRASTTWPCLTTARTRSAPSQ